MADLRMFIKKLFRRNKINIPISKIVKAAEIYEPYYVKDFFFLEYTEILNCCKGIESIFVYEFVRHHKKKRHIKFELFFEPDEISNEVMGYSAFCTCPIYDEQRKVFKNCKILS